jgi:hypothetical protein
MDISSILLLFDLFYGHLVYSVKIWYSLPRFGTFYFTKKTGNLGWHDEETKKSGKKSDSFAAAATGRK